MTASILLLEDDLQLSDTVKQFLELKGYEVYCAYDGLQAQDIVYEKHIDLMLLDVKVPNLSGFEFLKHIRDEGNTTPAIFITSLNSVKNVTEGFDSGCDDYIRKPFALKELLVRVESLLKRSYGSYNERIELGDGLWFDTRSLLLMRGSQRVALKTKELKLLALFLQYPNELLEYEKIFEALWEYEEEPSSGSLRAYIKTLSAEIGKEMIETVKNIGYRFVTE
jgi:DNA-binding response OmpR family regulator